MDTSDLINLLSEKIGGDSTNINSIFEMLKSNSESVNSNESTSESYTQSGTTSIPEMPDIETIMKIKKILDSMKDSSNDPNIKLLSSLKPYLRDEKKSKIDEYIKFLNMSRALSMFNDFGGDNK